MLGNPGATSTHFTAAELCCHHGINGCEQELVDALEAFRAAAGKPVMVDSAFRCPICNARVGGAPRSEHMLGMAADIRVEGMTGAQLEAIARTIPAIHGIGRSDFANYLHIDVRPTPAEWTYNASGQQQAYYPPKNADA